MKLSINLASRRHINQSALKLFLSVTVILLVLLLGVQIKQSLQDWQLSINYQSHLDTLQEQLQGKLPERLSTAELAQQQQVYDQAKTLLQRDAFRWTALFDRMELLLPSGVSLRSFKPGYDMNILMIAGVAKDLKSLQDLLDNLQKEKFHQVFLKNHSEVKVNDGLGGSRTALSFSISLKGVF